MCNKIMGSQSKMEHSFIEVISEFKHFYSSKKSKYSLLQAYKNQKEELTSWGYVCLQYPN